MAEKPVIPLYISVEAIVKPLHLKGASYMEGFPAEPGAKPFFIVEITAKNSLHHYALFDEDLQPIEPVLLYSQTMKLKLNNGEITLSTRGFNEPYIVTQAKEILKQWLQDQDQE